MLVFGLSGIPRSRLGTDGKMPGEIDLFYSEQPKNSLVPVLVMEPQRFFARESKKYTGLNKIQGTDAQKNVPQSAGFCASSSAGGMW